MISRFHFASVKVAMLVCGTRIVTSGVIESGFEFGNFTIPYPQNKYPVRPNLNPAQCFGVYSSQVMDEAKLLLTSSAIRRL